MDSKTGFSVLIILIGITGLYLAFTGKLQAIFGAKTSTPTAMKSDAGKAGTGSGGSYGGSTPAGKPSAGGWSDPLTKVPSSLSALAPSFSMPSFAPLHMLGLDFTPQTSSGGGLSSFFPKSSTKKLSYVVDPYAAGSGIATQVPA